MITIKNPYLELAISEHGAELKSLRKGGREYLWQADERFWKRTSPVLFPIVGSVWEKKFRSHGAEYPMGQHGFARDMDFTVESCSADEAWFCLESDSQTLAKYPYRFRLRIGYRLEGHSIRVMWKVENLSDETMYFQIGAHPAFHWPMLSDAQIAAGTDAMVEALAPKNTDTNTDRGYFILEPEAGTYHVSGIGDGGCFDPAADSDLNGNVLKLDTSSFDADAIVFENSQVTKVTLCGNDLKPYLSVEYDAPVIGLWSPPAKNAPFVCIEPWYGRADSAGYCGDYEHKPWINSIAPASTFCGGYIIDILH